MYKTSIIDVIKKKGDYNMDKEYLLNAYGNTYRISLEETSYYDGNYAIIMHSYNETYRLWENWDVLTTNLPEASHKNLKNCAYVQSDKYLGFVLANELGTPTGNEVISGFNHYTEIEFSIS